MSISETSTVRRTVRRALPVPVSTILVTAGLVTAHLISAAPASAADETCDGQAVTIVATQDGEVLQGTDGPDVISTADFEGVTVFAGGGDDLICATSPRSAATISQIHAEDGNDVLQVSGGPVDVYPGPGDDTIHAPAAAGRNGPKVTVTFGLNLPGVRIDVPAGTVDGEGRDVFTGVAWFEGTRGHDVFTGGPERDFFTDETTYDDRHPTTNVVHGYGGDDAFRVFRSKVYGGPGNDVLVGWHNQVHGGPGDDRIGLWEGGHARGGRGADTIDTSINYDEPPGIPAGTFHIDGGRGSDKVFLTSPFNEVSFEHNCYLSPCRFLADGGPGKDVLSFRDTAGKVHLDLATGRAVYSDAHAEVARFEEIQGSRKADVLLGTGRADHLDGAKGDDHLVGRGGPDVLRGGKGHDVAEGGPGHDRCVAEVPRSC